MGREHPVPDRRRHCRLQFQMPVELLNGDKVIAEARSMDISPSGMRLLLLKGTVKEEDDLWIRPKCNGRSDNVTELPAQVRWKQGGQHKGQAGVIFPDDETIFSAMLNLICNGLGSTPVSSPVFQEILDAVHNPLVIFDQELSVISISRHFPFLSFAPETYQGGSWEGLDLLFKHLSSTEFNFAEAASKALASSSSLQFQALACDENGKNRGRYFNITLSPIHVGEISILITEVRDVTLLYQLKERLGKRDDNLLYQARYMMLGQIFDELLEDIVNPLSAVVGRLDLLQLKIDKAISQGNRNQDVISWASELETITGLFDDVVEFCRIAAKRRERDKLSCQRAAASLNDMVDDALGIIALNSDFRKVDLELRLRNGLPAVRGDRFAWTNAYVYILQAILKRMKGLKDKKITLQSEFVEGKVVLRISHNGRALMLPLEKTVGFGLLEFLVNRYNLSITTSGVTGNQTISLYMEPDGKE